MLGVELTKAKPRRLKHLQTLLTSFEHAESQAVLAEQNKLQREANELTRLEYQRRQQIGAQSAATRNEPKVIESLTRQIGERDATIRSLTQEVERVTAANAVLQQSADILTRLRAEAASDVNAVLGTDEVKRLHAEWEELKAAPASQETVDRMNAVLLQLKVVEELKSTNRGDRACA
jgi:hypothetical protein